MNLLLVETSSEDEGEADDELISEYTESVDEEETRRGGVSLTSTEVRASGTGLDG